MRRALPRLGGGFFLTDGGIETTLILRKSHAELNEATELDIGDPVEFGREHAQLKQRLPQLNVMGGCCGTDHRHVEQIALACSPLFRRTT